MAKRQSPEWVAMRAKWRDARGRCTNPRYRRYDQYAERGVWMWEGYLDDFTRFYADHHAGYWLGAEIDRIDAWGGYTPDNIRWVDKRTQQRNRRNTRWLVWDGERRSLPEWAEILGVTTTLLETRVRLGWTDQEILNTPKGARRHRGDRDTQGSVTVTETMMGGHGDA